MWNAKAVRHIISGVVVAGHRCRGRPSEVVVQHLSERTVLGYSDINQSLVGASDRAAIHFVVLPISAVHPNDAGLVTIGVGIRARSPEGLSPISS